MRSMLLTLACLMLLNYSSQCLASPFDTDLKTGEHGHFTVQDHYLSDKFDREIHYRIDYTRWRPDAPNGNTIVYLHGLQSHRGWFYATAERLRGLGYTLFAFDRAGSGSSESALAQNGWPFGLEDLLTFLPGVTLEARRSHASSYSLHLDTLDEMINLASAEFPNHRLHLWGNSYAAKIVSRFLQNEARSKRITSTVMTTPGLYRNDETMPLPFSKWSLISANNADSFPSPVTELNQDNGASWFTSMAPWHNKIQTDPLSNRSMTREMALQTRRLDKDIEQDLKKLNGLRRFYLLVEGDAMMDNLKTLQTIKLVPNGAILKYYQGGEDHKHFLSFTTDREQALIDIHRFLINDSIDLARAIINEN